MSETTSTKTEQQTVKPNPDLKSLEKLIGTWRLTGGIEGTNSFEWAEGNFFLIQHFDFVQDGRRIKGIELIGHEYKMGEAPGAEIRTRVYSFLDGMTLDYIYESDGNNFTIWFGEKGSESHFDGKFSEDGNSYTGEWTYPGGGYQATGTRIK